MKHFHWDFIGYEDRSTTGFNEAVEIMVVGHLSEDIALEAAKNILKRPNYYLRKVWECTTCAYQKDVLKTIKDMHGPHD